MEKDSLYLHPLPRDLEGICLPAKFTFPFYYRPHPIAVAAAKDLQAHLLGEKSWEVDFGVGNADTGRQGKMFGVLVVREKSGKLGYLAAYSGKLAESNHLPGFVPPVYDLLDERGFYRDGEAAINDATLAIEALRENPSYLETGHQLEVTKAAAEQRIAAERDRVKAGKRQRKKRREEAKATLSDAAMTALESELARQSIKDSYGLKDLTRALRLKVGRAEAEYAHFETEIGGLVEKRKRMSAELQDRIFTEYTFLNALGKERGLGSIFSETVFGVPPAGAGECAAPKLLQYAFSHDLQPVALAEFWWGQAPSSEIRQHGQYYPACKGKCEPILSHMLQGMEVDPNPLLVNPAQGKELAILYEDEDLLVVDKPHEFLSVPGKHIEDSVWLRIRKRYPSATGPLIVHRLDMSTSGLLLVTKNQEVHKKIQRQFFKRSVEKRYVAVLEGELNESAGIIDLPLRGDLQDRPRQIVCPHHGKTARTRYGLVSTSDGKTKVNLWPVTGRTHQLRVHCAHPEGLGMPILGDDLYGTPEDRLYLHAAWIAFIHPVSGERLSFESPAPF